MQLFRRYLHSINRGDFGHFLSRGAVKHVHCRALAWKANAHAEIHGYQRSLTGQQWNKLIVEANGKFDGVLAKVDPEWMRTLKANYVK